MARQYLSVHQMTEVTHQYAAEGVGERAAVSHKLITTFRDPQTGVTYEVETDENNRHYIEISENALEEEPNSTSSPVSSPSAATEPALESTSPPVETPALADSNATPTSTENAPEKVFSEDAAGTAPATPPELAVEDDPATPAKPRRGRSADADVPSENG